MYLFLAYPLMPFSALHDFIAKDASTVIVVLAVFVVFSYPTPGTPNPSRQF
jgi:hypothetical protein